MHHLISYQNAQCFIHVNAFQTKHLQTWLAFVTGTVGVAANGWLVRGLLISPLLTMKTHLLMLNLAITCLGRGLLAGFPFSGSSTLAGRFITSQSIERSSDVLSVPSLQQALGSWLSATHPGKSTIQNYNNIELNVAHDHLTPTSLPINNHPPVFYLAPYNFISCHRAVK